MAERRYRADLVVQELIGPKPDIGAEVVVIIIDEGTDNQRYGRSTLQFGSLKELDDMIACLQNVKRRWTRADQAFADE